MPYPDISLHVTDPIPQIVKLNVAQIIFGTSVIGGTNSPAQIQLTSKEGSVNFKISFELENIEFTDKQVDSYEFVPQSPDVKFTPTFEKNDSILRMSLSFKIKKQ
jgi:hypothetical protein